MKLMFENKLQQLKQHMTIQEKLNQDEPGMPLLTTTPTTKQQQSPLLEPPSSESN